MTSPAPTASPSRALARLGELWRILGPDRTLFGAAIALQAAAAALQYVVPLVPQAVIDGVFPAAGGSPGPVARTVLGALGGADAVRDEPWRPALAIAAAAAAAGALTVLRGRMMAVAAQRATRRLRERVHARLVRVPVPFFDRHESGDLLQRATSDIDTVQGILASQAGEMGRSVLLLAIALPMMLAIDWRMAVASTVLAIPVIAFAGLYFRTVSERFRAKDEAEGRLTARAQENVAGIRVVRAFGRQAFERDEFRARNAEHRDADVRLFDGLARFWALSDLTCLLQLLLVLVAGLALVAGGSLGTGDFFFFLFATNMYIWPIRHLGRMLADLGKATVAIERLHEVLDCPAEEPADAADDAAEEPLPAGPIRFEGIRFAYPGGAPVLHGIDLEVGAGETVAIMGPSGAGKSTLLSLLLRFREPDAGCITVGGEAIRTLTRSRLRRRMASVLQPPFLYSRSIRDNVAIVRRDATPAELAEAADRAAVHDTVERFVHGWDTVVGERGITLSGGQRQRIAIARALLSDADVLLLDDSLSAVDSATERRILDAMRSRRGRRPTIVVAHRLSTLAAADRIVVIEGGRVAAQGTHAELVSQDGLYRRLWAIQAELEDEERATAAGGPP